MDVAAYSSIKTMAAGTRPIAALTNAGVEAASSSWSMGVPYYIDSVGLDSTYDYDTLWAKAVELQVAVTMHGGGMGWPDRTSPSNFVYNHIGHFATAGHAAAKALLLGGVTQRFPRLNFAFLEGGVRGRASCIWTSSAIGGNETPKPCTGTSARPTLILINCEHCTNNMEASG